MTLGYTKDSRQMPCSISDVFQTLELLLTTGQMDEEMRWSFWSIWFDTSCLDGICISFAPSKGPQC